MLVDDEGGAVVGVALLGDSGDVVGGAGVVAGLCVLLVGPIVAVRCFMYWLL